MTSSKGSILVTGANGSLGIAIAEHIAKQPELSGYHGLYTVRDPATATGLASTLQKSPSHLHDIIALDLTDLDRVREVARSINHSVSSGAILPIRVLILNAGVQEFDKQTWTDDGLDTTFSANYLGHWLLTLLLLESMDKASGRILMVGSQSYDPQDKRNAATFAFVEEKYKTVIHGRDGFEAIAKGTWSSVKDSSYWTSGFRRYGASKLFLLMMMYELQRRLDRDSALHNICFLGVDPGTMITRIQRHAPWFIRVVIFQIYYPIILMFMPNGPIRTTQRSASDLLHAAFDLGPGLGQFPKALYFNGREPLETSVESRDIEKCDLVWKESVRYTRLKAGDTVLINWE